ncbi:nucleotidyltransferase family protein [Desulfopila inferna]|mgnify:CR=1 FL=1|uniref:nucleotidyltransferase family protein n=1 Tax=Desulfopila inferna TaxID=468528 RepID=UPI0027D1F15A|nr:nucleotidyltransferase family protein [Desulfopila inferna]
MKITGIILAAGLSNRMGEVKSLLPFGKSLLLGLVINNVWESILSHTIVVLGSDADRIRKMIDFKDATVVFNPDYRRGQSSSLKAGLQAVDSDTDGVMFLLGDQPFIDPKLINTLIGEWRKQPAAIIIPVYDGKRGNPVVAHRNIFPMIRKISGDSGLRQIFQKLKGDIREVEIADPGILMDIDTVEDYRELLLYAQKRQEEDDNT